MKVLLVGMISYGNPLGCAYLKAYADADPRLKGRVLCELAEFERFMDVPSVADRIARGGYDVVGFSTYIWNFEAVAAVCRALKALQPSVTLVAGGPQLSFQPEKFFELAPVDFVAIGEGEQTFCDLLHALSEGLPVGAIPGLVYRDGAIKANPPRELMPDVTKIPSPVLTGAFDPAKYNEIFLESSRGCPYDCSFCDWQTNQRVRYFPEERIVAEIERIAAARPDGYVFFADADFFLNKPRAKRLLPKMIAAAAGSSLQLGFETNLGHWDEEMLRVANDFRVNLHFGVQSLNPEALKAANRDGKAFSIGRILDNVALSKRLAPRAQFGPEFMMGMPGDTLDGYRGTLDWMLSHRFSMVFFNQFLLLPGSPFSHDPQRYGIVYKDRPPFRVLSSSTFSSEDMARARAASAQAKFALSTEWSVAEGLRYLGRLRRGLAAPTLDTVARFCDFCRESGELPWLDRFLSLAVSALELDAPEDVSSQPFHGQFGMDLCRAENVSELFRRFARRLLESEALQARWPLLERFLAAAEGRRRFAALARLPKFHQLVRSLTGWEPGQHWLVAEFDQRSPFSKWGSELFVWGYEEDALPAALGAAASACFEELDGLPSRLDSLEPGRTFDGAVLNGVLSYVPARSRAAFLRAVSRRVRPGGRLLIVDDWQGFWPLSLEKGARAPGRLAPEAIRWALERCGLGGVQDLSIAPAEGRYGRWTLMTAVKRAAARPSGARRKGLALA